MSGFVRSSVARAVALALFAPIFSVHAQQAGTTVTADTSDDALPEVIVTAQFVRQNVQDTPIAITAVTGEMMDARGQDTIDQVAAQAPNVTLKTQGASMGPSLIGFIRGVGQTDFNPALEPGVGLYVDDVYYSTLTGSVLDLLDLERVEILRGPQGTLAGKNSIGGSIKMYSKRPQGDNTGYVEAGYGNFNAVTVRGAADFALAPDSLFLRISGVSRSRDGYVDRVDYGCSHPGSGVPVYAVRGGTCVLGHEGGIQYTAGRLGLRWIASDSLEVNLAADITSDHSEVPANILMNVGPTLLPVGIDTDNNPATGLVGVPLIPLPPQQAGYDLLWNAPGAAGACRYIAYGSASCDPLSPNNPYINYSTYMDPRVAGSGGYTASAWTPTSVPAEQTLSAKGASANIDWQITENLQLQSITAYRTYDSHFGDDADGTPLPVQLLLQTLEHSQFSQELRLNGGIGDFLDYTVGGFYFDQDTNEDARVDIPYAAIDFLHGPDLVPATTWALFAHGIFHFTEKLNLALGVRYTDEEKNYTYARHNPDGTDVPGSPPCPAALNCAVSGLNGNSGPFADTRTDYRAALDYRWTDDFMTYLQFSTGYKGGGLNPRPFNSHQILPFGPETLDAYELGLKSQLFDRTLRLNAAVFYNEYNDIQLGLNDCTIFAGVGFGIPCILPANVGNAEVKGIELEANWYPTDNFELDASISTLDFEYTEVDPATGVPPDGISPYTPELKWSLGAQYTFNFANGSSLTPRVDVLFQDDVYGNPINSPTALMDSYTLLNARITWASEDNNWQVALEGQNLTDELYFTTKFDLIAAAGGFQSGQPALPMTFMLTIKRNFN